MSEERNIDAFFKTVLDRPVEGVDPTPAWESFEKMASGMQSSSPNNLVYKASWLGAIASFMLMTLLSVFDNGKYSKPELVLAEQSFQTLPIVRFDKSNDKQESLEENIEGVHNLDRPSILESGITEAYNALSEKPNRGQQANQAVDYFTNSEQDYSTLTFPKERLEKMTAKSAMLFLPASLQDIQTDNLQVKSPQFKSDFNRNVLRLIASSNTFEALIASGSNSNSNAFQSLGLEYQRQVSPKFAVSVGFAYAHRVVSGFENAYDSVSYSFGSATHRKSIQSQYTQNLLLPVSVSYYPSPKHEIQVGAELAYLLDVHSQMTESIVGHENELPVIKEYVRGYRSGFNDFQSNALLAYRYQLTKAIQLGVNGRYAITDAVNADQFDRKGQLNAFNWQVQLTYKLRDF